MLYNPSDKDYNYKCVLNFQYNLTGGVWIETTVCDCHGGGDGIFGSAGSIACGRRWSASV
jgi:hypothetical protein